MEVLCLFLFFWLCVAGAREDSKKKEKVVVRRVNWVEKMAREKAQREAEDAASRSAKAKADREARKARGELVDSSEDSDEVEWGEGDDEGRVV